MATARFSAEQRDELDRAMLDRAGRAALRGTGHVEPNPIVGCVIGRADGTVLATAHHERFGGLHAEASALELCRARGIDVRGATVWVTLEPCNHAGKTPACAAALRAAGVARVVYAVSDPNPIAAGGAATLREAGVEVVQSGASQLASAIGVPFVRRVRDGRPWVIAKWAQTRDGFLSFTGAEPRWVSDEQSRRDVHRLRGRVDCVLTGIGTVQADDPLLTARGVVVRRRAVRAVVDRTLEISPEAVLVQTATTTRTLILTSSGGLEQRDGSVVAELRSAGAELVTVQEHAGALDLAAALRQLAKGKGVATVLLEAGPRLIGAFAGSGLIDEAWVYEAPHDAGKRGEARVEGDVLQQAGLELVHTKRMHGDTRRIYRALS